MEYKKPSMMSSARIGRNGLNPSVQRNSSLVWLLKEYQAWRKAEGKYAWNPDPEKNEPMPFTPQQLSAIEDAAIDFLSKMA